MKTREATTEAEWEAIEEFLGPIAEATEDIYGSRQRLADAISARIGSKVAPRTISRWFTRRNEPKLGIALIAKRAFKEERAKICSGKLTKTWVRRRPAKTNQPTEETRHNGKTKKISSSGDDGRGKAAQSHRNVGESRPAGNPRPGRRSVQK